MSWLFKAKLAKTFPKLLRHDYRHSLHMNHLLERQKELEFCPQNTFMCFVGSGTSAVNELKAFISCVGKYTTGFS